MTEKTSTKPMVPTRVGFDGPLPRADELPEPPKRARRVLSTPVQAMAVIESWMDRLTPTQKNVVSHWFVATYNPSLTAPQGQS